MNLQLHTTPAVESVFEALPEAARAKLLALRALILEVAERLDSVATLEETLKWGEPSYIAAHGSTIRIAWKEKSPDMYGMYFQCTSRLVPTFRAVFPTQFQYEGTRAILFKMHAPVPEEALKACIKAGLTYHKVKHLPLLDMA